MSAGRIRPRLVAVWGLVIALVAVIVVVERNDRAKEGLEQVGLAGRERMLVTEPLDHIGAIEVVAAGEMHRFERDPAGIWFSHGVHAKVAGAHGHQTDPVLAESIARAVAAFSAARLERDFRLDTKENTFGVTTPGMVVLVYRPGETQPMAQFATGDLAPDGVSQYVLPIGGDRVYTVAAYQFENLSKLVATAKAAAAASTPAASTEAAASAPAAMAPTVAVPKKP